MCAKKKRRPDAYQSLSERLDANSRPLQCETLKGVSNCRQWTGYVVNGYGRMNIRVDGKNKSHFVHRVAEVLSEVLKVNPLFDITDEIQKKQFTDLYVAYGLAQLTIDHLCKNSLCINPFHLEWVYLDQNQRRKKWCNHKRREKIQLVLEGKTRHQKRVARAAKAKDLSKLIKTIKARRYRIKTC